MRQVGIGYLPVADDAGYQDVMVEALSGQNSCRGLLSGLV